MLNFPPGRGARVTRLGYPAATGPADITDVTSVPLLQRLARRCDGEPEEALEQILGLLCEQLGMSLAVIGAPSGECYTVHVAVTTDGGRTRSLEGARPQEQTLCGHVPAVGHLVVRDVADEPELGRLESTRMLDAQAYVGTAVRGTDGRVLGVLGAVGHDPHLTLNDRDLAVLDGLAEVASRHLEALLAGSPVHPAPVHPAPVLPPRTPADLGAVAEVVTRAEDLESLTRPLLDALHELSGIASTYLTLVRADEQVQEVRYALNTKPGFAIPEGIEVPWADTLCKRSLDEGRMCTTDVPVTWPDSETAAALGIVTYVSVPVRLADGRLWGTLCAADNVAQSGAQAQLPTLTLFARLIAGEVERSAAMARERAQASHAQLQADTDELTGCSSKRTVLPWLTRQLDALQTGEVVAVAFVDIDRFKAVNDRLGHGTGDELLATLGLRLLGAARAGDLVARIGGDEFVLAARLPRQAVSRFLSRVRGAGRFELETAQGPLAVCCSTGLATSADVPDPSGLLSLADAEMYRDKPVRVES